MDKNELLDIFTRQQRIEVDFPGIARSGYDYPQHMEVSGTGLRKRTSPSRTGAIV
jgi:hypothetical protein